MRMALLAAALLCTVSTARGQTVEMSPGDVKVLVADGSFDELVVGESLIADVQPLSDLRFTISANEVGRTAVVVLFHTHVVNQFQIVVLPPDLLGRDSVVASWARPSGRCT